jgi:uncharacterized membrane protein YhaH (DUF805 family)
MEKLESDYNMIDWWKKVVFKNYANFTGRARRAEYWYFVLGNFLLIVPFYIIAIVGVSSDNSLLSTVGMIIYGLVALGTIIPGLAAAVRRLHDLNKSGWYYFIGFIPIVGGIILLVWFFTDGNRFTNNYGTDPKNVNDVEFDFEQPTV